MDNDTMSDAELIEIIETRPENLILASEDALLSYVQDDFNEVDLRRVVLAELVIRWCLSGRADLEAKLAVLWGDAGWRPFSDWYSVQAGWSRALPENLECWPDPPNLPGLSSVLRSRLARLFEIDGFIPVCRGQEAFFLPFVLLSDKKGALWLDGSAVSETEGSGGWGDSVIRALSNTPFSGIRLWAHPGAEFGDGLTGESLMLPVKLAAWRRDATDFPQYDVLSVLATGALDDAARLEDVDVRAKFNSFRSRFGRSSVFFGPDVPGEIPRTERRYCPIDHGTTDDGIRELVRDVLERKGLSRMTRDYARGRLVRMSARVDRENHHRWAEVAEQLASLRDAMSRRRDFDEWLEYMSLLATAYCHAGMTESSRQIVAEALDAAEAHGRSAKALRLQLTAAVNAQDFGEMDVFFSLADGLGRRIESFDGPEKRDLLMRYHGTLAQAYAWSIVFGMGKCNRDDAIREIDAAVQLAYDLASEAEDTERDMAEANVAQDLNYAHMLQALFDPGSDAEISAYHEACAQLENIGNDGVRKNNKFFLMRQKSLALYNAWRLNGSLPSLSERRELRLPLGDAENWLVMTNRCHLGALAAAAGEEKESLCCFREGDEALPLGACWAPVFASIRMAFLAQAVLSLRAIGHSEEAASYEQKLHDVFGEFRDTALFLSIHAERWMDAIAKNEGPSSLPSFYY